VFGDPITSKILGRPLVFDKTLAKKLSLNFDFSEGKTETQVIGSATRAWRELTKNDVNILLKEIEKWETKVGPAKQVLSSEEVSDVVEKHIEDILAKQPDLIGRDLKLERRQLVTDDGRIDLLFQDLKGNKIVVEVKLGKIGRSAVKQTKRYMKWIKKNIKKKVSGVIVCEGVMPAFEEDLKKLKDIKIFCYGWQLTVFPWSMMK
jgi:RecB family endonuclease NucS